MYEIKRKETGDYSMRDTVKQAAENLLWIPIELNENKLILNEGDLSRLAYWAQIMRGDRFVDEQAYKGYKLIQEGAELLLRDSVMIRTMLDTINKKKRIK